MSTPEQIVYDVLGQCGVLHGTRWYAARYVVESLSSAGLLVEGAPTDALRATQEALQEALKSSPSNLMALQLEEVSKERDRYKAAHETVLRHNSRLHDEIAALAAAGVTPPSSQCDDDGCLHYDHSSEQDDPMDEDLTVYWVCGECGAKESVRGAAMATGPKHTCEGPNPAPGDDLSDLIRNPHTDPDATPMSGEEAVQYQPAPSEPEQHEFLPVNGHPDDDECTYRADGTNATYCGEPRSVHECTAPSADREKLHIDDDYQHIYWFDSVEGCWVAYRRSDCVGEEELPQGFLAAPAPVSVDYDGLGLALFEKSHEPSIPDDTQGMVEAVKLGRRLIAQYVNTEIVAPVDEAKLVEVIDRAEKSTQTGSKPHRHRVIARAVIEYLKGDR